MAEDDAALVENEVTPEEYKTYPQRWFVLAIFSLLALLQCLVWNTFGAISISVKYALGWSNATFAMIANWADLFFILTAIHLSRFISNRGLRSAVILGLLLISAATCLRVVCSPASTGFLVLAHLSSMMNGVVGVVVLSVPPMISAVWFGPSERATATSIAQISNLLGNGVSCLLGPAIVPDNDNGTGFALGVRALRPDFDRIQDSVAAKNSTPKETVVSEIRTYVVTEFAMAISLLLAALAYFPPKPPTPPSPSVERPRMAFKEAAFKIAKDRNMWLVALAYAFPTGFTAAFAGVMTIAFEPLGVDDERTGLINFVVTVSSLLTSLVVARFADRFRRRIKSILSALLLSSSIFFVWLALLCAKILPFSLWQLFVSTVAGFSLVNATMPLFFEYAVELAFPAPEAVVGTFLAGSNNVTCGIFLCVMLLPFESVLWMEILLATSSLLAVPLVILTKEHFARLDIDSNSITT